jgi:Phosphatidylglycerol lysyltransferase, C-terminal
MSTLDLSSTSLPPQSASRPLSLSSSTTLHDENSEHHDRAQTIKDANTAKVSDKIYVSTRAKVNTQPGRHPKNNVRERRGELGYQKVLRTMITEPREPPSYLDASTSTVRRVQDATDVQLRSWKRALRSIGVRKFSQVNKDKAALPIFNLKDDGVARAVETLMAEYGRGTYLQEDERAAICFKVIKKVAVMYGDPLCAANQVEHVFQAFHSFCHRQSRHVAVVGAGPTLAAYAQKQCWKTIEFAVEQILNPMTNTVLDETSGKTITRTNRKLATNGIKLYLYEPRRGIQAGLEQELMEVYNAWQEDRRKRNTPQAYSAVINPFAMPAVTRYIYTSGDDGKPNSLAGLIRLGANSGYLLEPCIQLPDTPKGVTGFLVTHAMGLLRDEGVTYMTFGLEALPELGEITLMPSLIEDTSRHLYRTTFNALGLLGRKTFHESFHPESDRQVPLYLLFPPGLPRVSVYQSVLAATHISPHEVWRRSQAARSARRK